MNQYSSIKMVMQYITWGIGIAIAVLTLRIIYIFFSSITSSEEGDNLKSAIAKVKNRIKALVICVLVVSIIQLIKSYYFH